MTGLDIWINSPKKSKDQLKLLEKYLKKNVIIFPNILKHTFSAPAERQSSPARYGYAHVAVGVRSVMRSPALNSPARVGAWRMGGGLPECDFVIP